MRGPSNANLKEREAPMPATRRPGVRRAPMTITFEAEPMGPCDLRLGRFRVGGRTLTTPYFFPVMNVITGPPTPPSPVLANGGIWKWLKRLTLLDNVRVEGADHQPSLPGFLNQVLHFLDYNITPQMLERWLPPGEQECIPRLIERELSRVHGRGGAKRPFLFLDSGGYQLLGSQHIELGAYGMETTPRHILDLQLRFGGDFLATLDYPIGPRDTDETVRERRALSMKNALSALRMMHQRGIEDKLVFMAVHGRNEREAYDYARALLARVADSPARETPFGLALGSLVPLNNSPRALLASVRGAMRALREAAEVDVRRIPVHAFGVSSTAAPFLSLMGVDSYDGFSYAQAAKNLTYYQPGGFSAMKLDKLEALSCTCAGCVLMERGTPSRATTRRRTRATSHGRTEWWTTSAAPPRPSPRGQTRRRVPRASRSPTSTRSSPSTTSTATAARWRSSTRPSEARTGSGRSSRRRSEARS
jgi:tRNA-guanine family transglycosylase